MAPPTGLEPVTHGLTVRRSTDWAMEDYSCWHLPIFPSRHQLSIFGTIELNFRVRYGNGWTLNVINTNYFIQLFNCIFRVTRGGIEPPLPAWEAGVLTAWPTSHNRLLVSHHKPSFVVHHQGLEPWTPWLRVRCSTNWANGAYFAPWKLNKECFASRTKLILGQALDLLVLPSWIPHGTYTRSLSTS